MSRLTLDRGDILKTIPHREPFLFLKSIKQCDNGQYLLAEMVNGAELPFYKGHFPFKPVMPGVLIIEGLAQAACFFFIKSMNPSVKSSYYLGSLKVRLLKTVGPEDTIELLVHNKKMISTGAFLKVTALSKNKILLTGEMGLVCKNAK